MGYWIQSEDGKSLQSEGELIWGDQPADILGAALDEIISVFRRDRERLPTGEEIKAGLLFSLAGALERATPKSDQKRPERSLSA